MLFQVVANSPYRHAEKTLCLLIVESQPFSAGLPKISDLLRRDSPNILSKLPVHSHQIPRYFHPLSIPEQTPCSFSATRRSFQQVLQLFPAVSPSVYSRLTIYSRLSSVVPSRFSIHSQQATCPFIRCTKYGVDWQIRYFRYFCCFRLFFNRITSDGFFLYKRTKLSFAPWTIRKRTKVICKIFDYRSRSCEFA